MRFMMLMIPEVYQGDKGLKAGKDFTPGPGDVEKMTRYNEELAKAGALVALDGLHPPIEGARVSFRKGKPIVTAGPYIVPENALGGYWIIQVTSREEAIEWAKRVPARDGDVIEVRQIFDISEFPEEVRKAADNPAVSAQVEKFSRSA
ncbi:MAG TPA: YciI family protein [Spirochaetota bacterium]|nr:YciI family protein [Spirochaetota bacterium]HOD13354.1 YciI family protein [Spirochaetota bacterium]HPG51581.1 YciI family protein [Spirochaetota bacterium]HPN11829.1 YciI family protein [Spirochaetota bacterium]HQL80843.1 YciI family protein [Spirochaetota bacterium]